MCSQLDDPTYYDNIAGRKCRVIGCRRTRCTDSFYCEDHLRTAIRTSHPLKVRIRNANVRATLTNIW